VAADVVAQRSDSSFARAFPLPCRLLGVSFLAFLSLVADASAYIKPVIEQNLPAITGQVAQGGAVGVPGVSCGSTCTVLYQAEQEAGSLAPLVEESTGLRQAGGTLPRWSTLGTVAMGANSFLIGWTIGSGIYKKFLTVEIPPVNPATGYIYGYRDIKAKPCNPNWSSCIAPGSPPGAQFYFNTDYYEGGVRKGNTSFVYPENPFNYWPPVPGPFTSYVNTGTGWTGGVLFAFDLTGPIEPYTNQPYDRQTPSWTGQPQSQAELEDRVRDALDSGSADYFQAWDAFQLDPENYPDPRKTDEEEDHRCDRTPGATYENPLGSIDPEPFAPYVLSSFYVPERPTGTEEVDVFLRYGETFWVPGRYPETTPQYIDDWGGWGYRHIKAKHGWSNLDQEETETALLDPAPELQPSGNWLYESPVLPTPGSGGVGCFRQVALDFEPGPNDPAARGIVTSFNVVVP
jgi:hypothetical protein